MGRAFQRHLVFIGSGFLEFFTAMHQIFLRHPTAVKGTVAGWHRDGRIVEEGLDVAAGVTGLG